MDRIFRFLLLAMFSCHTSAQSIVDGFDGYEWYVTGEHIKKTQPDYIHLYNFNDSKTLFSASVNKKDKKEKLGAYNISSKSFRFDQQCNNKNNCLLISGKYTLETTSYEAVDDIIEILTNKYGQATYSQKYDSSYKELDLRGMSLAWITRNNSAVKLSIDISNVDQHP